MNDVGRWDRWQERAREMSISELHYARLDCAKTAEAMDKIDREHGGDSAGPYRDEGSVYALEMARRSNREIDTRQFFSVA